MGSRSKMRKALQGKAPGLAFERRLWAAGHGVIAGLDEVGRGSWAGPLTVGAVVVNRERRITGVRDSKMLTEPEREALYDRITGWAVAWSIGHASNDECDDLGMSAAQRLAARRALDGLVIHVDHVLLDGSWDFVGGGDRQAALVTPNDRRGDAAASVVAKVTRDRILREAATRYPAYAFADNKGYPAPAHREALAAHGATDYHRRSWSFMDGLPGPMRAV